MKKLVVSALKRALWTVCETLAASIPAGIVVTPVMIQELDITILYVIGAWILTGLLSGLISFLKSLAVGLPEAGGNHAG